jgi:hypothetical protein
LGVDFMVDFPLMVASVVALVGGGMFAWREQKSPKSSHLDQGQAVTILAFVAALILFSCLSDLGL